MRKSLIAICFIPILLLLTSFQYNSALRWQDKAIADCELTASKVAARPGASWNSEFGWMSEDQCERLRIDQVNYHGKHNYRYTASEGLRTRSFVPAALVVGSTAPS